MSVPPYESLAALALIFVLPGFALSRALFPEWRFRGEQGTVHLIETASFSLVLSVSLTILAGFALENTPTVGFSASWGHPWLEGILFGITVVALVVAVLRGAFSRVPPPAPRPEPAPGSTDPWPVLRELDRLARQERRIRHALRLASKPSPEADRLSAELDELRVRGDDLRRRRQEEYAD
jgi:hypothetical protein